MAIGLYILIPDLGYQMIETPLEEFEAPNTISPNLLATALGEWLIAGGAPETLK